MNRRRHADGPSNATERRLPTGRQTGEAPAAAASPEQGRHRCRPRVNFEVTPLKVGDTLYVCTPHSWVEAFDAQTGRPKWRFDPHAETKDDVYLACRGVACCEAPAGKSTPCPRRIIAPVLDARLLAVNADTGVPCEDFGEHGFVSLTQYLGHVAPGFHFVTSPPNHDGAHRRPFDDAYSSSVVALDITTARRAGTSRRRTTTCGTWTWPSDRRSPRPT